MDLENIIDLDIYTEEGKEEIKRMAHAIQLLSDVLPIEDFEHVITMLNGGHLLEFLDIANAIASGRLSDCSRVSCRDCLLQFFRPEEQK